LRLADPGVTSSGDTRFQPNLFPEQRTPGLAATVRRPSAEQLRQKNGVCHPSD
jgi:hypothetical protein